MKKFILMLAISLGGIFSAQAQNTTFDFSCATEATVFINNAQAAQLVANDFREGTELPNGATERVATPNHYAWQIVPERVTIDALSNNEYVVKVLRRNELEFTQPTYNNFADALSAARLAQHLIDPPVLTETEVAELDAASFNEPLGDHNVEIYNLSYDIANDFDGPYLLSIIPVRGGGFVLTNNWYSQSEDEYSSTYTTLAEAITAAQLIIGG